MKRIVIASLVCLAGSAAAQGSPYTAPVLSDVRRAADLIPGDPPSAVNVVTLSPSRISMADMVEGGATESVEAAMPVFQIRFPRGWIAVDAAMDRALVSDAKNFSDEQYAAIQHVLRDAHLVVVTHEHDDHVGGVIRSPFLAAIRKHTLLTRAQVEALKTKPNKPSVQLDSATASRYLVVDYEPILPIAPGVVLIKAPGHTPGSQMVYVRLASGKEIVLAGDVAWNTSGVVTQRQKPVASTQDFGGEDRAAIATELRWLNDLLASGVAVVISHDQAMIATLVQRGVLHRGFDMRNR